MGSHVVANLMLNPLPYQRDILETRFHMAKQAYNRVRDEWLKRRNKYMRSPEYKAAHKLEEGEERHEAFKKALSLYPFYGPDSNEQIQSKDVIALFGKPSGSGWCSDMAYHLNSEMLKRIGGMAARAVWFYHKDKDWGKPKPKYNPPPLVACNTGITLDSENGTVRIGGARGGAKPLIIKVDTNYLNSPKIKESLSDRKKYCKVMICREMVKGKPEYKCKITCNGSAPLSPSTKTKDEVVGVDVGPSVVAFVGEDSSWIGPILNRKFVDEHAHDLKKFQRMLDRQRRANNPDCYNENGTAIKGKRPSNISNRMLKTYGIHNEAYRTLVEERRRQHYELCKIALSFGNKFIVEDNSYKGWQSGLFGAQMGRFAPSSFIECLEEKAVAAGGWVKKISTWDTYLSSRCHCGQRKKKDLSTRIHSCECGVKAQRDLYSAYLARYIGDDGSLDHNAAKDNWERSKDMLDIDPYVW